jgi:hypothetical protein
VYYAPRAVAFEQRFACCIAWGAQWDYQKIWLDRFERLAKQWGRQPHRFIDAPGCIQYGFWHQWFIADTNKPSANEDDSALEFRLKRETGKMVPDFMKIVSPQLKFGQILLRFITVLDFAFVAQSASNLTELFSGEQIAEDWVLRVFCCGYHAFQAPKSCEGKGDDRADIHHCGWKGRQNDGNA